MTELPLEILRALISASPKGAVDQAEWLHAEMKKARDTLGSVQRVDEEVAFAIRSHEQRLEDLAREKRGIQDGCFHLVVRDSFIGHATRVEMTRCLICGKEW